MKKHSYPDECGIDCMVPEIPFAKQLSTFIRDYAPQWENKPAREFFERRLKTLLKSYSEVQEVKQ